MNRNVALVSTTGPELSTGSSRMLKIRSRVAPPTETEEDNLFKLDLN